MKKVLAIMLAAVVALGLCACDGGSGSAPAGEVQTNGNITVFVPENMQLIPGSLIDENDPDTLTLQEKEAPLNYVLISIKEEEDIKSGMDMTKEFNEDAKFTDFAFDTADGGKFEGFTYESFSLPCSSVMGTLAGGTVQVDATIDTEGDAYKAILESIAIGKDAKKDKAAEK